MYMPKLGTMLLRNRFACVLVLGVFIVSLAWTQTQPATTPGSQPAPAPGQGQQPSQAAPTQNPPAQNAPNQATPQNQAPASPSGGQQSAPAQGQAPPGQSPQGPSATDNGVFTFTAKAEEVTLHSTVVAERNRPSTNLPKGAFTVS